MKIGIVVVIACTVLTPSLANAFSIDDVAAFYPTVVALRASARGIAGGASQGFREEAEKFMTGSIDPLLGKVNGMIEARIEQTANAAMSLLQQAELALTRIIDNANQKIEARIAQFFGELRGVINATILQVDDTIYGALCRVAPGDGGIQVVVAGIGRKDSVCVWRPHANDCYNATLAAAKHPLWATFEGRDYYDGKICETQKEMALLDINDQLTMARTVDGFRKLAMYTTHKACYVDRSERDQVFAEAAAFMQRAAFFQGLVQGTASLIH